MPRPGAEPVTSRSRVRLANHYTTELYGPILAWLLEPCSIEDACLTAIYATASFQLESVNDWTLSVQSKKCLTVAYIDFSRAFDSVSHEKLFIRLLAYDIQGDLLRWLLVELVTRSGIYASDSKYVCLSV